MQNSTEKADLCIRINDTEIKEADKLLVNALAPQVQTSSGSEVADQWSHFKPQQNLAPTHLDQGVTHMEVSQFVESMIIYITVGFRGVVPTKGVWMYIAPFLASSWWASIKSRGVQDKSLEEILQAIMGKSAVLCPVQRIPKREEEHQLPYELLTEAGRKN